MSKILNIITKNIILRSIIIAVLAASFTNIIDFSGNLDNIKSTSLNHYYTNRKNVELNKDIVIWSVFDDDIDLARWPWSWDKFAEMFKVFKLYNANLAMILEETFSEVGKITTTMDEAIERSEKLIDLAEDKTAFLEKLKKVRPDSNADLAKVIKSYPNAMLTQKFLITDDQSNPEKLKARTEKQKLNFPKDKIKAIEKVRKYGIPWEKPGQLIQAIDIHPLHGILSDDTPSIGFNRIVPDEDGTIRKTPTVVYYDGTLFFSKGIIAAANYYKCPIENIEVIPGKHLRFKGIKTKKGDGDITIPIDERGLMHVNWTGIKQLNLFTNYPFKLIKNFMVFAIGKKVFSAEDEFDPEIIPNLKTQLENKIVQTGFIHPNETYGVFIELLASWCANAAIEQELEMQEAVSTIKDIIDELAEHKIYYYHLAYLTDLASIYQSITLNNYVAAAVKNGEQNIDFNQALKTLNINPNLVFKSHLDAHFEEKHADGKAKTGKELVIKNLLEEGFLSVYKENAEDNKEILYVINETKLSNRDYETELKIRLSLSKDDIKKYQYMYCYNQIYKHKMRTLKEGFEQTVFFAKQDKLAEVMPLYFQAPIPPEFTGQDHDISLLDIVGKSIFVGLTATGLNALNPTPYDRRDMMAGLAPAVFNTITTEKFIERYESIGPILVFVYALIIILITFYTPFYISIPMLIIMSSAHYFGVLSLFERSGIIISIVLPLLSTLVAFIFANIFSYWQQQQERKQIRGMFSAMVSPEVLKIMEEDPDKFNLQGEKVVASMFSSDVSGFTSISEGVTAQELALILNLYLTPMSNLVMAYGGYVEKYEGDAIKADFGMPMPDNEHAWKACFSALIQQEELLVVQRMLQLKYGVMITARMGVNTGVVNAGNMGSVNKMQYCAIGEEVAMAEELEPSNKMWETWIAIGPETHRLSGDRINTRMLDTVEFPHVTIPVYEVLGWNKKDYLDFWIGKPIPKLVVETWEKIIPEKILAYINYYEEHPMPKNGFQTLMLETFKGLQNNCISYVKNSDILNIHGVNITFNKLQADIKDFGIEQTMDHLTDVDISEMERLESNLKNAKGGVWEEKLHGNLYQLKKNTHHLTQMIEKMERLDYDEFNTTVDTMEKNHACYIKRNLFPDENDEFGSIFSKHLQEILGQTDWSISETKQTELQKIVKSEEDFIKAEMSKFIAKSAAFADDYHEFIADHCTTSEDKQKTCDIFAEGREFYLNREWDKAIDKFKAGLEITADDGPCITFIDRCEKNKEKEPEADWNGNWEANW